MATTSRFPTRRRARLTAGIAATLLLSTTPTVADQWRVEPGIRSSITYTDNVALSASDTAQGSVILGVTPRIGFTGKGSRYSVDGEYALSGLFYTNAERSDQYYNNLNLFGNVEAIENFFYVDGGVNIFQNFLSPFGAISIDESLQSGNLYTSYIYRLNPYLQGNVGADTTYLLRWNNTWADYSNSALRSSYISNVIGQIGRPAGQGKRFGWNVDYNGNYVKYNNQDPYTLHLGRGVLSYQLTPELQVSGRAGYENNNYALNDYSGAIYGAGLNWQPTPRTGVDGYWEHRFFGSSYQANFQHRTRLTGWRLTGSRNVTTSAEQLQLGTGIAFDVVDAAFTSRIPDATQRQREVQQFLQQTGLPSVLTQPINFINNEILLQNRVEAAFSLFGARNSLVFTVYWSEQEPITGAGTALPGFASPTQDFVTQGASANYTHRLSGNSSLSLLALRNQTRYRSTFRPGTVDYTIFRAVFSSKITARTTWFAGARYQWQDPSNSFYTEYSEAAVFGGIDYAYR